MTIDYYANDRLLTKIDDTTNILYVGKARLGVLVPEDSNSWLIYREYTRNGVTTREYASNCFNQKWSDRTTIFTEVEFISQYSADFDGVNDSCNGGDVHAYDAADAFSHTLWVKPQNVSAQRCIFAKATDDTSVYGIVLYHTSVGKLYLQMRSAGALRSFSFSHVLTPNVWQHIGFTYAGASNINGSMTYLNGVAASSAPSSGSLNQMMYGQDFTLGSRNSSFNFSGLIKDHVVWNKNLIASEVLEQYNGGELFDPSNHTAEVNAKSFYRMGDGDAYPSITDNIGTADLNMEHMSSDSFVEDTP